MIPCVIYAAKSTEDKRGSIPDQLADCRQIAQRHDWTVIGEFTDEGFSAYKANRGAGLVNAKAAAEAAAAAHGSCRLIVQHSDRLARGDGKTANHLVEYFLWALKADIQILSAQDPQTFGDMLYAVVTGQRNSEDSRRKALAVSDGMARRTRKGLHIGGPRKFGYDYARYHDGNPVPDAPMVVNRAEAALVLRIYLDADAGVSQQQIQRQLNREGAATATGRRWHQGTIAKLLADPFYKGLVRTRDDEWVDGQHEAIVPSELWDRVAAARQARRKSKGTGRGRPPKGAHVFVNGHLRCGRCGASMVPRTSERKAPDGRLWGKTYEIYRCYSRIQDPDACDQPNVPREPVDAAAVSAFAEWGHSAEHTRQQIAAALAHEVDQAAVRRQAAEAEVQDLRAQEDRVKRDYRAGKIHGDFAADVRRDIDEELEAARNRLQLLRDRESEIREAATTGATDVVLDHLAAIRDAIAGDLHDADTLAAVRAAITRLFECFTLRRTARGDRPAPDLLVDGAYHLVPEVRPEVLEELMEHGSPRLRKTEVPISTANKYANGLHT